MTDENADDAAATGGGETGGAADAALGGSTSADRKSRNSSTEGSKDGLREGTADDEQARGSAKESARDADGAAEILSGVKREFSVRRVNTMIAGDQHTTIYALPEQRGQHATVPVTEERLHEPFVEPVEYSAVRSAILADRVVVIRGPDGCGKESIVLRALTDNRPHGRILSLQQDLDDLDLSLENHSESGDVLLWCDPTERSLRELTSHRLRRWSQACEARNLRLIITTDESLLDLEQLTNVVTVRELTRSLDPWDVLQKHVLYRLADDPERASTLLDREDLRDLCRQALTSRPLRTAVHCARLLAEGAAKDPIEVLQPVLFEDADTVWLKKLDPLAKQWALALAVVNGLPQEYVSEAAGQLERALEPKDADRRLIVTPPPDPFRVQTQALLKQLRARQAYDTWTSDFGRVPGIVLRYEDRDAPGRILDLAWRELPAVREAITAWLEMLGRHENTAVRTRAASAAGLLARQSFDLVLRDVIKRWAVSDNRQVNRSAATALVIAALQPTVNGLVDAVVEEWIKSKDSNDDEEDGPSDDGGQYGESEGAGTSIEEELRQSIALRCTAALYLGLSGGHLETAKALERLEKAADSQNPDVIIAVGVAVSDLVYDSSAPTSALSDAIGAISRWWTRSYKGDRRLSASVAAYFLLARMTPVGTREGAAKWPRLLDRIRADPGAVRSVALLWAIALVDPLRHRWFRDALDDWAGAAERSPRARDAFLTVLREVAVTSPRHAELLRRRATAWCQRNASKKTTGEALLNQLSTTTPRTGAVL